MADVLEGRDGYLFAGSDGNRYLDQLTGDFVPSERVLAGILFSQINRYLFARDLDCRYIWALVPGKERLLRNWLPDEVRIKAEATPAPVHSLLAMNSKFGLGEHFPPFFRSLGEPLRDRGDIASLFHRTDTHWTHRGAHLAYKFLIQSLADDRLGAPNTKSIRSKAMQQGDLGTLAGLKPERIEHYRLANPGIKSLFDNEVLNIGQVEVFEGRDKNKPTAIILRSSSFDFMRDFLLHHFSRALLLFSPDLSYELVAAERPYYILHMQQERYLLRSPSDLTSTIMTSSMKEKGAWERFKAQVTSYASQGGYFLNPEKAEETAAIMAAGRF